MKLIKMSEEKIKIIKTKYEGDNFLKLTLVETSIEDGQIKKEFIFENENGLKPIFLKNPENFLDNNFQEMFINSDIKMDYFKKIKNFFEIEKYFAGFFENNSHNFFNKNKEIITRIYSFDYIGSLKERFKDDPVYKELIILLKEHPFVKELKEGTIPYYNEDFFDQKGIVIAKVSLSQEKYSELYEKYKGEKYYSVRMTEAIKMTFKNDLNIYGKEISNLLNIYFEGEKK